MFDPKQAHLSQNAQLSLAAFMIQIQQERRGEPDIDLTAAEQKVRSALAADGLSEEMISAAVTYAYARYTS